MPLVKPPDIQAYRRDASLRGAALTPADRERLLKPYLPPTSRSRSPSPSRSKRRRRRKPIRTFLKSSLHIFIFHTIQLLFGIYIHLRHAYRAVISRILALLYHHHRTPELIQKDVRHLSRLPEHLSIILHLRPQEEDGGLTRLMDEAAEVAAWCACAGIPLLSVYEKSGPFRTPSLSSLNLPH